MTLTAQQLRALYIDVAHEIAWLQEQLQREQQRKRIERRVRQCERAGEL